MEDGWSAEGRSGRGALAAAAILLGAPVGGPVVVPAACRGSPAELDQQLASGLRLRAEGEGPKG